MVKAQIIAHFALTLPIKALNSICLCKIILHYFIYAVTAGNKFW